MNEGTAWEIAEALGIRARDVVPLEEREGGISVEWCAEVVSLDTLPDLGTSGFMEEVYHRDLCRALMKQLATLLPRHSRLLAMYYGLGPFQAHNLQQIASYEGVSQERIRQIISRSLRQLRHPKRNLKAYL